MKAQDYKISSEKFVFHSFDGDLHDNKLETKPVSYFRDALNRFAKNKASIVAFVIIVILVLFAIIAPIFSPYSVKYNDTFYSNVLPKVPLFKELGLNFWDGGKQMNKQNQVFYEKCLAIEQETGREVFMTEPVVTEKMYMGKVKRSYSFRCDTYNVVGVQFVYLNTEEYLALQEYQDQEQVQIILPITDPKQRPTNSAFAKDAYIWFKTKGSKVEAVYDKDGNFIPIYQLNNGNDGYQSTMYYEGEEKLYNYAVKKDGDLWELRVDYASYYEYYHSEVLEDGITKPLFIFGTNDVGKDLFTCLASGARFSFILAILVASFNLFVGAIYGAIEGYYGGKIDLIMERIVDILASIPFMIVITLLKYHLNASHVVILFISFFLTGWTGMAARTRMQFYRFKNQEYVLVAKTLGARDRRVMFKHIFPNALGTLITGSVLVIPSVIFSETTLSYLNIIDLNTSGITSVGTLLAKGQNCLYTFPHVILFPAIFICLLMLCFNLFGNGLRDAFNPSLRGTEE